MSSGITVHPAFTSTQLRVSLVTLAPGATLRPPGRNTAWVIALDTVEATRRLSVERGTRWIGGTVRGSAVRNGSGMPVQVIEVVKE